MLKRGTWVALALCGLAVQQGRADTVLVSSTSLVIGSQSSVYSFQTPGPGTVVAQVTNVDWPQTLSSLSFLAGSANQVMASWADPSSQLSNTLTFDVTSPGLYFADIMATAGGPLDLGVYSLCIKFVPASPPVPLPLPAWLLLAGLLALAVWWQREASRRPAIATGSGVPARSGA